MPKKQKRAPKHITTIRVEAELYEQAKRVAELSGMSVTSGLGKCLEAGLPRLEKLHQEFLKPDRD